MATSKFCQMKNLANVNRSMQVLRKNAVMLLATYLLIQILTRFVMLLISGASTTLSDLLKTFALGTLFDLAVWSIVTLPFLLILKIGKILLLRISIIISDFITIFIAVSQVLFFREFATNFNFIAVDYLIYTNELIGNIGQSFNVPAILLSIIVATAVVYNIQRRFIVLNRNFHLNTKFIAAIIVVPLIFVSLIQSTWRDYVSDNRYNVEISANGTYEFVRAYFTNELDYDSFYATLPEDTVIANLRKLTAADNSNFIDDNITHNVDNQSFARINGKVEKPNVIMITVESLNAEYLSIFGGSGLTPNLDSLVDKSYTFTKMYATGTRTVRGLEALSLSLPPTPGQSIVRRENNDNLASLGDAFRQNGYERDFIYGGYGYFDNMNDFFSDNGYEILDRTSIDDSEITHETIWGVADEDLFTQVLKSMDNHFSKGEPAFEMVMTTSNHRPFTFPEGRIDMPDGTRNASVKYTDWAIADFLKRASSKAWFKDTIFVIVADHQALAAGKTNLPVNRYHIPCLIYAPSLIVPGKCERLISQMDLAPTLLGMLGLSYKSKFLGCDINHLPEGQERIFISTYQLLGYIKNDTLTILMPNKKAQSYQIDDWKTADYTEIPLETEILNEAISYYQGAAYLFKNNLLKAGY